MKKSFDIKLLLVIWFFLTILPLIGFSQTTNDYRTAGSGDWNVLATWERWSGSAWVTPTLAQGTPTNTVNVVTIQSPHVITVTANVTVDQTTIAIGGQITVNNGIIFTINNGTGTDLTNNGIFLSNGTLAGAGSFVQGANSSLTIGGTITVTTLTATAAGNAVSYSGAAQIVKATTYVNLTLSGSGNKTFAAATAINGAFIVQSGTNALINNSITVNATGSTTVDGTLTINNTTGNKYFYSAVTINSGGVWNETANEAVTFRGGITNNGTFTTGTGTHTFSINSQAISGNPISFGGAVTITGVTLTNNTTVTVTGNLTGTGTLTQANDATLIIKGTSTVTGFNVSAIGNTVNYNRANTQTVRATTYHHLTISGSNIKTLGGAITVNGNLSIQSGTLSTANFSITGNATGTFSMASSTTLNLGSGTTAIAFPTNYITANISLDPASTIVYNSNQALNISTAPAAFGNLTLSATSTKTATSPLTINGNLTVNTGNTFAIGANTITIKKNLAITGTCSGTGKLLLTSGTAAHAISGGTSNICNLELDDTYGATFAGTGTTTITGNLTVTSGTLTLNNFTTALVVTGSTNNAGTLRINSTTGTKTFTGLVTNNGTWTESVNEAITFRGGITNNGTFTANTGIHTFATNNQALNGTISIPNVTVTTITLTNNNTLTVGTALAGTGGLTQASSATLNLGGSSAITTLTATVNPNTVNYIGTSQAVKATTYHNLSINGAGTATIAGTNTINGTLTVNSNLTNNGTLTVTTGIAGNATLTNAATRIMNYAGAGAITANLVANTATNTVNYSGTNQTVNVTNYTNLTLSGSGTKTLDDGIHVTGTLTMNTPVTAQLINGGNTYVGTTLTLYGSARPVGTYGSTSSSATTQNDTWFVPGYTGIITRSSCIPGTWNGSTSTDWNTASNWCGGVLPTATTDVIIPNLTRDPIIGAAGGVCRNITITDGILGFSGANTLTVSGDWVNTGTFNRGTSTVIFNGTSQQSVSGTNNFNNLTLNNSNGLSLEGAVTVSNTLTLTSGQLSLGSNNLTISNNVAGSFSSTTMIVPEGTGNLVRNFSATGTYSFPVGSSSSAVYSPVSLTINTGTSGAMSVRLTNTQDLSADYDSYLKRAWTITATGITNYDVTFDYDTGDITGTEDHLYSAKSQDNGATWTLGNAVNAGSNQFSLIGQTSFSKFSAVGKLGATASADPTTLCQGEDAALTGGAIGGKSPYTWAWAASPATGVSYTPDAATQSPTATFANSGSYALTLTVTDAKGRTANASTSTITVDATNTITLTSGAGTNNQELSKNTALTDITFSTTGATGADVTDLPDGVTGVWSANVVTISGTPTEAGIFDYTVRLTGGCGLVTATGTITVLEIDVTIAPASPSNDCPELDAAKGFEPSNDGPYNAGATDVVFEVEWLLTVQEWQFSYAVTEAASLVGFTVVSVNAEGTGYSSTINNNATGTFLAIPSTTQTITVTVRVENIPGSQQDVVFGVTNAKYTDNSYSVNYVDNTSNIVIKAMPVVGAFN